MSWFTHAFVLAVMLFMAGTGIPIMAALNAGLGTRLGSPIHAAFILFLLALAVTAVLTFSSPLPSRDQVIAIPVHYYLGGLFVALYVLSITWIAPKIGLGNAIFLVLIGQLVAATIIDHHGFLNAPKTPATTARIVGLGLMVVGIYLAKKPIANV
ncbi:MAG: DMT family transporter [Gammaproteobacteria bacterium]|nr:DMT family transporter [Gammaproteobacteria bacterium]